MKYNFPKKISEELEMDPMDNTFFLIGLLSEFMNRYQTIADRLFEVISWKQCFALICLQFFKQPPTLKELSEMMGSSHQNVKQILLKLEKVGFIQFVSDEQDKRKQRIVMTELANEFNEKNSEPSAEYMKCLFQNIDPNDVEITIKTILQLDDQLKRMGTNEIKE